MSEANERDAVGSRPRPGIANFAGDFGDATQEWKRLVAELIGTFGLVLVARRRRTRR